MVNVLGGGGAGGLWNVPKLLAETREQHRIHAWKFVLKGTVSVIAIEPLCKDRNTWFTTVPLKSLSDKNYER